MNGTEWWLNLLGCWLDNPFRNYVFGHFELHRRSQELYKHGVKLKLRPQPFKILYELLSRPGDVVTREELREKLWSTETFVDFEQSLNTSIKELRAVLGDSAAEPRYVETVPRLGYRFIAKAEVIEASAGNGNSVHGNTTVEPGLAEVPRQTNWRSWVLGVGTAVVITAAVGFSWYRWMRGHPKLSAQPTERQLTANPPEDSVSAAAISPDGKYVAYVDPSGLLVRSVDSGDIRPISLPADFPSRQIGEIRWHPNGEKLLVSRSMASDDASIWMLAVVGAASPTRVREGAWSPAISPDGKSMVFESGHLFGSNEIWVSGINGEAPRKLVSAEDDLRFDGPVWSPDGHWIAYVRRKKMKDPGFADTTIEIQPASGGPSKTLVLQSSLPTSSTIRCAGIGCLCWSSGWTLVFTVAEISQISSRVSRESSLWQLHVNLDKGSSSQKPRLFAKMADFSPGNLSTTADGKILAFTKLRSNREVYVGELDPSTILLRMPRRLTLETHNSAPRAWMQDNRSLLFISDRNGKRELFKQGLNDSVPERIVSSAAGEVGYWAGLSPDGSWLLYWEYERTEGKTRPSWGRLMRQPADGGPPETVIELPYSESVRVSLSCAHKPGNPCVLSGKDKENLVFYAFDPVRGKGNLLGKIEIDEDSNFGSAISPDGSRLAAFDHSHKNRIELLTLSNRAWHEIDVEPGWGLIQSLAWTPDGKGFFLTTWLQKSFNLIHVTQSGKVKLLLNSQWQWMTGPLPSTDGRYLAFEALTWDSNVWLLENF